MQATLLAPITRQFPSDFSEKHLEEQIHKDISRVLDVCNSKISSSTEPHAVIGSITILHDDAEHHSLIKKTYSDAVLLWNKENETKSGTKDFVPVYLYVQENDKGVTILAGIYEPISKASFKSMLPSEDLMQLNEDKPKDKIKDLDLERPPQQLVFDLSKEEFADINAHLKSKTKKNISELMASDPQTMWDTLWKFFTTDKGSEKYDAKFGQTSDFEISQIKEGDSISYRTSPASLGESRVQVAQITVQGVYSLGFVGSDGENYVLTRPAQSGKVQIVSTTLSPDENSIGFRYPGEVWASKVGDCDEVIGLVAAFLKHAEYKGDVSLVHYKTSKRVKSSEFRRVEAHAFMLSVGNDKNKKYYRLDFTKSPKMVEVTPVFDNGVIDLKKTIEKSYSMDGINYKVDFAREVNGFTAIESYCAARKLEYYLGTYWKNIPNENTSEYGMVLVSELEKLVDNQIDKDPTSADLYVLRSNIKQNWHNSYVKANGMEFSQCRKDEVISDVSIAIELEPTHPAANYKIAIFLEDVDVSAALYYITMAHKGDTGDSRINGLLDAITKKSKTDAR